MRSDTAARTRPTPSTAPPRSMFEKLWRAHRVADQGGGAGRPDLLMIDRHLLHEVTSPQAFAGLAAAGRRVRRPERTLGVADHVVPTAPDRTAPGARLLIETLRDNCAGHGIAFIGPGDPRLGIVHVIAAELGLALPGASIACGDSHTSTLGAFGCLAFGIGSSEVAHVLATQCLAVDKPRAMRITVNGILRQHVTAKDLILAIIAEIGAAGGRGHAIEFTGRGIRNLTQEGRMTVCNMAVEAGARFGLVAPDERTFRYLRRCPLAPRGAAWTEMVAYGHDLASDLGATFDREIEVQAEEVSPMVTWGTNPEMAAPITARVPDPARQRDPQRRTTFERALAYMGLAPGTPLRDIAVDRVFIGSCTNARLDDLREAATVLRGRKIADGVAAMVAPGSAAVRAAAEEAGLDEIFVAAGFDWRGPGCSMCIGMNGDILAPGERCASTSSRNFEGRQGPGGRTHLMSPAMAAAAAVTGRLTDVRELI